MTDSKANGSLIGAGLTPDRPVWVLGLNIGAHDSSAVILRSGRIIAMAEQERFSRRKRALGEAPVDATLYCLSAAGINLGDLSAIALGSNIQLLHEWLGSTEEELLSEQQLDDPERLFPRSLFTYDELPPIIPVQHHIAHAASAFWPSGFDAAAILVVDNRGEHSSSTLAVGQGPQIALLEEYGVPVSLGLYYRCAAQYTGLYRRFGEVGKLMGLAPYGKPNQPVPLRLGEQGPFFDGIDDLPPLRGRDIPAFRTKQLLEYFERQCYPFALGSGEEPMAYANFAASVQESIERTILGMAQRVKERSGLERLVMAGGVALNCSANGRLVDAGIFDNLYVQPAAHDAGVALGAALEVTRQHKPDTVFEGVMEHAYWGPEYSSDYVRHVLDSFDLAYQVVEDCEEYAAAVAGHIAEGRVVGWFQGRGEFGPRALGARSLLADPTKRRSLVRLNHLKGREVWRPLAPSILRERYSDFFHGSHASPFMLVAAKVMHDAQRVVPTVVHVDGTARPQAVNRLTNEKFWLLIQAFADKTGIPLVVNTSFNLDSEPIVNTPEDAVKDFLQTDIDVLAIGEFVVAK